ncbi:MAG: hypothetical protein ACT4OQ_13410 [Chloroflexota bacterium]
MVSPRPTIALLAAMLIGVLAACTPGIRPVTERPAPTDAIVAPAPSDPAAVIGEVPAEQLDAILDDAARRTGVDAAELETIRASAMTWPDGSLGCPEPGQTYTQALVDGYHVVVDAADESLDYRATTSGSFRLCEGSGRPADG